MHAWEHFLILHSGHLIVNEETDAQIRLYSPVRSLVNDGQNLKVLQG